MKKNNLIEKFLKFSYGSWIGLVLGVATTMIITRILSPEDLGKVSMFDLALQVGMIITIFGTDQSFVRFFYEETPELRGHLLYNTLRIPMFTSVLMIGIVLLSYNYITEFLIGIADFEFAFLFAIGIILQLLFRYGQLVIRMQQKGNLYSLLQIFQRLFNLGFILLFFIFIGTSYEILIYAKIITLFSVTVIAIFSQKQFWNLKNLKNNKKAKHSQLEIFRFGSPFVLTIFITWLFESIDKIALRQWSTFDELGLYSAAMRLVALVTVLKSTFSAFWTPVAYEKFEENPHDKIFFKYMSSIVSFAMFVVAILSIAGRDIIVLLLGKDYQQAAIIMPFLVFMPILYTISETTVIGVNFYKKTKWHIVIAVVACTTNIIGNWLLVPEYGAIGASVSTAFSYIVFFTLRTVISLTYYKVQYPLFKIYLMIFIVTMYALYAIFNTGFWSNIILSVIPITILIVLFYKDLIIVYKYRNRLLN